jgi:hypothetical protein
MQPVASLCDADTCDEKITLIGKAVIALAKKLDCAAAAF